MKSKFLLIVMTLLGMFSLFSVGFASWVLTKPIDKYEEENAMNTIVYEAYDNAKYLYINGFTKLQYYNTGFVKDNVEITDTANLTISFTLDVKAYKEYLASQKLSETEIQNTSVALELILKHASDNAGLDFFNSSLFDFSYTVEGLTGTGTSGNSSTATITLSTLPVEDSIDFSVTYNIKYKNGIGSNFKTNVFEKINGKIIRFALEAKITNIE